MTVKCKYCPETNPAKFGTDNRTGKHYTICRACKAKQSREKKQAQREAAGIQPRRRNAPTTCLHCGTDDPSKFGIDTRTGKRYTTCRACKSKTSAKHKQKHPEQPRAADFRRRYGVDTKRVVISLTQNKITYYDWQGSVTNFLEKLKHLTPSKLIEFYHSQGYRCESATRKQIVLMKYPEVTEETEITR